MGLLEKLGRHFSGLGRASIRSQCKMKGLKGKYKEANDPSGNNRITRPFFNDSDSKTG